MNAAQMTISEALSRARARLSACATEETRGCARTDAELLLTHALGQPRSYLYAHAEEVLPPPLFDRFEQLLERRLGGIPVAYLLGSREFYGLTLRVNPAVLIPRPETELLVDAALERIPRDAAWTIADLGSGSGAIALAIAHNRPCCQLIASDVSTAALGVAKANARQLGLDNIRFINSHWLDGINNKLHMVLSNPPYVAACDPHLLNADLRHEPLNALTPGSDGLSALATIIHQAPKQLFNNACLILEHGFNQGVMVRQLMAERGFEQVSTRQDLNHIDRLTMGYWPGPVD